jgi:glycosyltransferase involved in cell wall biosynthesis
VTAGVLPVATVVVPTRDRAEQLGECLAALEGQTVPNFEIVVVDDASQDAAAVAAVVDRASRARVIRGEGRGPAAARNLGVRQALGPVVCLTDDDCRPESGWLAAILARIDAGADVVSGPMLTGEAGNVYAVASQTVTNHLSDASFDPAAGTVGFAPTSNVACRAEVLRDEPFDETYPLAAGEDREWCERLARRGVRIARADGARVWHHQRLTVRTFWRQQVRYGMGAHRFHTGPEGQCRPAPSRFYADLVRTGFGHGVQVGVLVLVAQLATAVGVLRGVVAARRRDR